MEPGLSRWNDNEKIKETISPKEISEDVRIYTPLFLTHMKKRNIHCKHKWTQSLTLFSLSMQELYRLCVTQAVVRRK